MITIDSQIWIYFFDPNAIENSAVSKWLTGKNNKGPLFEEEIVLNSVIPIEIGHQLFKLSHLLKEKTEKLLLKLLSMKNCKIAETDLYLVLEALKILKKLSSVGIGGRDALILATMERFQVQTIVTHDKNILAYNKFYRIDPVFDPPLVLKIGKNFDSKEFKHRLQQIR